MFRNIRLILKENTTCPIVIYEAICKLSIFKTCNLIYYMVSKKSIHKVSFSNCVVLKAVIHNKSKHNPHCLFSSKGTKACKDFSKTFTIQNRCIIFVDIFSMFWSNTTKYDSFFWQNTSQGFINIIWFMLCFANKKTTIKQYRLKC